MAKNEHAAALGRMAAGISKTYGKAELALRTRRLLKAAKRSRAATAKAKLRDKQIAAHRIRRARNLSKRV